jgi:hypothetical protein
MRLGVKEARTLRAARLAETGQLVPKGRSSRQSPPAGPIAPAGVAPVPAVAPEVTTAVEPTSVVEKSTSEAKAHSVGRGSPTPPVAGPQVSSDGLGPGLETCGLLEGGVMRPAPNEAVGPKSEVEKPTSEANGDELAPGGSPPQPPFGHLLPGGEKGMPVAPAERTDQCDAEHLSPSPNLSHWERSPQDVGGEGRGEVRGAVEKSTSEAKVAAPDPVQPAQVSAVSAQCDPPTLVPGLPHLRTPWRKAARDLKPRPPEQRPVEPPSAYGPRDG